MNRIALIVDIHGNAVALQRVLDELDRIGVERVICLGDIAATGPQPHEAIASIRERSIPTIMGNADAEILDPPDPKLSAEPMRKYLEMSVWGNRLLTPEDRDFLAASPDSLTVDLGGHGSMLCVHGSPRSFDEIIRADTDPVELDQMLDGHEETIIASGHTHIQMLRRHKTMTLINPGSVGLAYDPAPPADGVRCIPRAEFAVIDYGSNSLSCQFHRLTYDPAPLLAAARESGMPHAERWVELWSC